MRIGLTGTQSVGKSTLVDSLRTIKEFDKYEFQTERSKYLRDLGIPLNTDSTLKGQIVFLAERASELFKENIITDRSIIDVMAFTESAKSMVRKEKNAFLEAASLLLPQYDHIIYIPHDGIKLEHNGVRTTDVTYRDIIDENIRKLLKKYKHLIKNIHIVQGTNEERIEKMKEIIFM
mgnify:CR=1 FL=1